MATAQGFYASVPPAPSISKTIAATASGGTASGSARPSSGQVWPRKTS